MKERVRTWMRCRDMSVTSLCTPIPGGHHAVSVLSYRYCGNSGGGSAIPARCDRYSKVLKATGQPAGWVTFRWCRNWTRTLERTFRTSFQHLGLGGIAFVRWRGMGLMY